MTPPGRGGEPATHAATVTVDDDGGRVTELLVIDMATLRFAWSASGEVLTVLTARDEPLASVRAETPRSSPQPPDELPGELRDRAAELLRAFDDADNVRREAVHRVLERACAGGYCHRGGKALRVALYNPMTGEVAVGSPPRVFSAGEAVVLEADGTGAYLVDGADPAVVVGEQRLAERGGTTVPALSRALVAHR